MEKICFPLLGAALLGAIAYGFSFCGSNYTEPACLQSFVTNLYLWLAVLAILGCGRRFLNRENAFTRYMTRASFGLYILHYPVLLSVCYLLQSYCALPALLLYGIALAAELVLTFALYEAVRRIPVIRFLVLGQRGKGGALARSVVY